MTSRRIEDIEILRALAVLAVVLHHAFGNLYTWSTPAMDWVHGHFMGGFGVDLFFAISGFVIARDLVPRLLAAADRGQAWRLTLTFWIRRAWRLLPSAWLWLGLILLASLLFNQTGAFGSFAVNLDATLAGVLQFANVRFAHTFMQSPYGASFVYWSLSLEEQFYLLLPLLVLLSRRYLPLVLVAVVLFQWLSDRSLMMLMFRTDAIALGVLLAIWSRRDSYRRLMPGFLISPHWLGSLLLLGLYLLMGLIGSQLLPLQEHRFSLHALIAALLVWLASYDLNIFAPWQPLKRVLLWVGTRSYAIYLIHVPAYFATRELHARLWPQTAPESSSFWFFTLTATVLILVLSELNYRFVETPLRERGSAIARRYAEQSATARRAQTG
jgi:peptidoglycan/LPS O-acetylase OafA/YrhL